MTEQDRFLVFFGIWAILGLASGLFMWRASPDAKRSWFPRLSVLAGAAFVGFTYWVSPHVELLYFLVPAVAITTLLNIKFVKFCARCGAHHQSFPPFYKINFCRKCGAQLA